MVAAYPEELQKNCQRCKDAKLDKDRCIRTRVVKEQKVQWLQGQGISFAPQKEQMKYKSVSFWLCQNAVLHLILCPVHSVDQI
jgi:hypothetical protein